MCSSGKVSFILVFAVLCLGLSAGCANMFGSSGTVAPFYYGDFDDVPIPGELSGPKETTIITTPGGVKTGLQTYKGRAEVGSLNNAMLGYMVRDGWILRASTRGAKSLLLFEKIDRFCTIYIIDGLLSTEMQVYVSPKLEDTMSLRNNVYNEGVARPGGTSYTGQPLSQ